MMQKKIRKHMPTRNVANMTNKQFARHRLQHITFKIEKLRSTQSDYEEILSQYGGVVPERPFIVIADGVFLKFNRTRAGIIPSACQVEMATRFTKGGAEMAVASLKAANGDNLPSQEFEFIDILTALSQVIQGHKEAIDFLKSEAQNINATLIQQGG